MNSADGKENSIARLGTDSIGRLLWKYSLPDVFLQLAEEIFRHGVGHLLAYGVEG